MTKRNLENRLEKLEEQTEDDTNSVTVAYQTGDDLRTTDREPIDQDDVDGQLVVINRSLVMTREQAEREGRTILGPAENAADDVDAVKVAINQ